MGARKDDTCMKTRIFALFEALRSLFDPLSPSDDGGGGGRSVSAHHDEQYCGLWHQRKKNAGGKK